MRSVASTWTLWAFPPREPATFRQFIQDARHRVIGCIDTAPDRRQTGRGEHLRIVAHDDPRSDIIRD
jgi:hypothetical protein